MNQPYSTPPSSTPYQADNPLIEDIDHPPILKVVREHWGVQASLTADLYRVDGCDAPVGSTAWFQAYRDEFKLEPASAADFKTLGSEGLKEQCNRALRELAMAGAVWRYGPDGITSDILTRLNHELESLAALRMSSHFLLACDLERKARAKGMIVRTSNDTLNCLVGYLLGLSPVCPVEHGMCFESFAALPDKERPTLKLGCCPDQYEALVNQLKETYGHVALESVAHLYRAVSLFTDLGPLMGLSEQEVSHCQTLVSSQNGLSLEACLQNVPEFKRLHDQDARIQRVVTVGKQLEGRLRRVGDRWGCVVVSSRPFNQTIPMRRLEDCLHPVIGWDRPVIDALGLTRITFQTSGVIWILRRACEIIRAKYKPQEIEDAVLGSRQAQGLKIGDCDVLNLSRMPFDDPRVFGMFKTDDLVGVGFSALEAAREAHQAVDADSLESLIHAVSLGHSLRDLLPVYRARRHGLEPVPPLHPTIDRITAPTYGLVLYLDQTAQALCELTGQPLNVVYQALHEVRQTGSMTADRRRSFIADMMSKGLTHVTAEKLIQHIQEAAVKAQNKGRIASHAVESYWCAYLKHYFPGPFTQAYDEWQSPDKQTTRQA